MTQGIESSFFFKSIDLITGVIFEMIVNSISQGENIKTKSEPCLIPLRRRMQV